MSAGQKSLRSGALLALAASAIAGCSTSYDAGSSPSEQLCDVLGAALEAAPDLGAFELEPLLEGGAAEPSELPTGLLSIALSYRTNQGAYDQLGAYEPAIEFAATLVELAQSDLIGPSQLSPAVLTSALAVDEALRDGACAP